MSQNVSITIDEVKKLGVLSRIKLSDEEVVSLQGEMASILGYIKEIDGLSLDATASAKAERKNVWREDIDPLEPGTYTEKLLANAPSRDGNYLKVKKIL